MTSTWLSNIPQKLKMSKKMRSWHGTQRAGRMGLIRESCTQCDVVPPRSKFPFMVFSCFDLALKDKKKNQENGFSAIKLYSHTLCSCSLVTSTLKVEIQRAMSNLWPQTQGNRFLSLSKASSTEKGFENDPEEDEGAHFRKLCRLFLSRRGFVLLPSQQRFWTFSILCSIPICSKQSPRGYVSLYS